jgi:hypothetical protein
MFNSRDAALAMVEDGVVSAEQMLSMCLAYMSKDDVEEMLDANELSERFQEDDDGQPDEAQEWESFDADC